MNTNAARLPALILAAVAAVLPHATAGAETIAPALAATEGGEDAAAAAEAVPGAQAEDEGAFRPLVAAGVDLAAFLYEKRPVVVFADTPHDPAFRRQMEMLEAGWPELAARDVVIVTDTDPAAQTAVRTKLRPRGFILVLIDMNGQVALRKPFPWDVRELGRAIDRMR